MVYFNMIYSKRRLKILKYKLVAIDMDGTLLNSKNQVSERTRQAIMKAKEKGVHIIISTGRILRSALYYSQGLGLKNPIVASNGAIIVDEMSNIIYKKTIEKALVKDLVNIAKENEMYFHFYDESSFYSDMKVQEVLDFYSEGTSDLNIELKIFEDIDELTYRQDLNIYKFLFIDEDLDKLKRFRETLSLVDNINISSSWINNVEAMAPNVSKGQAIKELCKRFDVHSDQVIAIGDSENDLSMLNFAGLSVAMGNGGDKIKKQADYTTDHNDNDGVAKVIEKFILK